MANTYPARVTITAAISPTGTNITNVFNNVIDMEFNYFTNMLSITDGDKKFWFGFTNIATISCVITNGVPQWTISV